MNFLDNAKKPEPFEIQGFSGLVGVLLQNVLMGKNKLPLNTVYHSVSKCQALFKYFF